MSKLASPPIGLILLVPCTLDFAGPEPTESLIAVRALVITLPNLSSTATMMGLIVELADVD